AATRIVHPFAGGHRLHGHGHHRHRRVCSGLVHTARHLHHPVHPGLHLLHGRRTDPDLHVPDRRGPGTTRGFTTVGGGSDEPAAEHRKLPRPGGAGVAGRAGRRLAHVLVAHGNRGRTRYRTDHAVFRKAAGDI